MKDLREALSKNRRLYCDAGGVNFLKLKYDGYQYPFLDEYSYYIISGVEFWGVMDAPKDIQKVKFNNAKNEWEYINKDKKEKEC